MTSKYQELSELSDNARRELIAHQNRCRQYMATIVSEMLEYCEIPLNSVTYLRWDAEEKVFKEPEKPGQHYSVVGGMGFDEAGDCQLGVSFALPAHQVTFGLFVSEVDGKVSVKLGPNKPVQIDVNDSGQRNKFYDDVLAQAKADILKPTKAGAEPIGFSVSRSQATPDEAQ